MRDRGAMVGLRGGREERGEGKRGGKGREGAKGERDGGKGEMQEGNIGTVYHLVTHSSRFGMHCAAPSKLVSRRYLSCNFCGLSPLPVTLAMAENNCSDWSTCTDRTASNSVP